MDACFVHRLVGRPGKYLYVVGSYRMEEVIHFIHMVCVVMFILNGVTIRFVLHLLPAVAGFISWVSWIRWTTVLSVLSEVWSGVMWLMPALDLCYQFNDFRLNLIKPQRTLNLQCGQKVFTLLNFLHFYCLSKNQWWGTEIRRQLFWPEDKKKIFRNLQKYVA